MDSKAITFKEWRNNLGRIALLFVVFVVCVNGCTEACEMDAQTELLIKQRLAND